MADDTEDDDLAEGETVELPPDEEPDVVDTPDGGAIVRLGDDTEAKPTKFYDNLAEVIDESRLNSLGRKFIELIENDQKSRELRDKQYEEGIRRTGLGKDAPGGAQFEGASKVVHPVLTKVCVDFAARTIKELFPPNGPVKTKIEGTITKERIAKAKRKATMMNWQLATQVPSFRAELEQLLTQLPLGGSQYLKIDWDPRRRNRPRFEFIPIDDMLLPFAATNYYDAERKTHRQKITQAEFDLRVSGGMYRDVDLPSAGGMTPESTKAEKASEKVEGKQDEGFNQDGQRLVYETQAIIDLGDDDPQADGIAPYVMSIDHTTGKVLSLYRNWIEDDDYQEALEHVVEFPFVPWRGAYSIGMSHMIGGLSGGATGALRALLDSAFIQNSQSMVKLKGATSGGQSITLQPTQIEELEGTIATDDIRKLAMPLPFNPPSATLYQLLGFLVEEAESVVRTTLDETTGNGQNTPVGTEMSRIEQGMVVYSSIHGRLHAAVARVLAVLNRLNGDNLDDKDTEAQVGEVLASKKDFEGPLDITPVSDPNIFSEAQRFAQTQAVASRAELHPELYEQHRVEELILATLKVPDPGSLLKPGQTPVEENAVAENVKAALGRPILAYPEQDHIAHLSAHMSFMQSPVFGASQLIAPALLPVMMQHIKEHIVLWYAQEVFDTASDVMTGEDLEERMRETKDPKAKQALDRMIAEASLTVVQAAPKAFAQLQPVIAEALQMMQKLAPQMPQDPAAQVAMADVQMRGEIGKEKNQLEGMKAQTAAQAEARKQQAEDRREQMRIIADADKAKQEAEIRLRDIDAKIAMNTQDNDTALEIAGVGHAATAVQTERDRQHEADQADMMRAHEAEQADRDRAEARRVSQDADPNPGD